MDMAIDTNTEIGSVFLLSLAGGAVCAALTTMLESFDASPRNRGWVRISVSHAIGPTGVLSVVVVYARGSTKVREEG